jgi:hypothetical protein
MSTNGINPNDLFFDSECFSDYETSENFDGGITTAPIAEGGNGLPLKIVQFNPVVSVFEGSSIPLSGGGGFRDTRQYENERMGMQDFENSGSFSINDFGSVSDESLSYFTPGGQKSSGKGSNKSGNAPSVGDQNGKRNFDIFQKNRNNSYSTNEDDIGSNVGEVQNVANEKRNATQRQHFISEEDVKGHNDTELQHFISEEDTRGQISSTSNVTRTGQEPMTTNTRPSNNFTTEATRATKE